MRIGKKMSLLFSAGLAFSALGGQPDPSSAKNTIKAFYKAYLDFSQHQGGQKPTLRFSKAFQTLVTENAKVCKESAGTDICGWGANGDVYLNAQEFDPGLTFQNSRISITEPKPGKIQVKLNVYPSIKDAGAYYDRTIIFLMIWEANQWAVDDIFYKDSSARTQILDENKSYLKKAK